MSESRDPMYSVLDDYAEKDLPITIRLKGDFSATGSPMGPGKIRKYEPADAFTENLYIFEMPVVVGQPGKQGTQAMMPITIRSSDILWISTGVQIPDEPKVIAPPGTRSPGGIYT